ncbi:hypothetical protein [Candidatus Nitrospira nitrificans]|uniref:Uncharacterized protein n=1 Tax=Candidatus Nitrospira nitrificans TaxID=1742973 RepID=A0A0S4L6I5_9BACT|nr:hypothetical protein [Candidatus Nitrospira nitrificans]CUS33303.1 exported hypothetical protein [Candidatus Nitrospira nitrificans]
MAPLRLQTGYSSIASMISGLMVAILVSLIAHTIALAGEPDQSLKEAADGLRSNAEVMVAHGGMGDAKAIIHHCAETVRYAESIIKQLSTSHPGRGEGVASLNDVIRHCKRVAEIGVHADPGVLLNPAIKARTAAYASVKALGLGK